MLKKSGDNQTFDKKGRPNLLAKTLLKKTKDVIVSSCLTGARFQEGMLIAIGTGVVKANDLGKAFVSLRSKF